MSRTHHQDASAQGTDPVAPDSSSRKAHFVSEARRIVVSDIQPQVEAGRHALRRVVGDTLRIRAEVLCEGEVVRRACILYRVPGESRWRPAPMQADASGTHWQGTLRLQNGGSTFYCIEAWVDVFATWQRHLRELMRGAERQGIPGPRLQQGVDILDRAMRSAVGADLRLLAECRESLLAQGRSPEFLQRWLRDREVHKRMLVHGERRHVVRSQPPLEVVAERKRAAFCLWGHLPASLPTESSEDRAILLRCGVDIVHQEIVHQEGVAPARASSLPTTLQALESAVDLPLPRPLEPQWRDRHPEWFAAGPLASSVEAHEAPVDLWCEERDALWEKCLDVALEHVRRGARTLVAPHAARVPLPFWEWLVQRVHRLHPEVLFVSGAVDAVTARALARHGFSQSRVVWDGTLSQATGDITRWAESERLEWRPAPDVPARSGMQPEGGAAPEWSELRLVQLLAATASGCFGIRGLPRVDEALPWLQQLHQWRRDNHALQGSRPVALLPVSNPQLLAFSRLAPGERNALLVIVPRSLEPQEGTVRLPERFGAGSTRDGVVLEDLLDGQHYTWRAGENYVRVAVQERSAHVLRVVREPRLLV